MPPKKKRKTTKSAAASSSTSKPASSSRSTRSRTRSASITPASPTKQTTKAKVKPEPKDVADLHDAIQANMSVWDGEPQMECWVEIPSMPRTQEDGLQFIRPRDKKTWKAKGKHKEYEDSLLWHVDREPMDADPFYFGEEDLRDDGAESSHVVAVRPKAGISGKRQSQSQSASASAPQSKKGRSSAGSSSKSAKAVEACDSSSSSSTTTSRAPTVVRAASLLEDASRSAMRQRNDDRLEDMFLDSNQATVSDHAEEADPLFFEGASDQEDRLRKGTPVQSQSSQRRKRIKASPTYGDRIAQGANADRSRSSTPRTTQKHPRTRNNSPREENGSSKNKGKDKAREPSAVEKIHNKGKRVAISVDSEDEATTKGKNDDVNNLRSELNEDAFARSTGSRHKEEYRNKLAKFAEARKKARQERGESVSSSSDEQADGDAAAKKSRKRATTVSSGSESSDSDDDSDDGSDGDSSSGSGSSSSSGDSRDFIVADDKVEYDEGFQPVEDQAHAANPSQSASQARPPASGKRRFERDSDGKVRLVPISAQAAAASGISTSTSILAAHGLGGAKGSRKGLDEMCLDWIEWAAARTLVTWTYLSLPDRERLERNRAALKSRIKSIEESVGSVAMRRQFKWYLTQYPKIEVEPLFSDEVAQYGTLAKNGCGICHRKSQKAQFKVTLSGERYNQEWLSPLKRSDSEDGSEDGSDDSDTDSDGSETASDRSSDNETWVEQAPDPHRPERKTFTFFAGNHCAQRAAVMHQLHHWEWTTMQTLAKHDSIRFLRRLLWRKHKMGRGKDGEMGCGAWEVWFAVNEMIAPTGRCTWPGKVDKPRGKGTELERLRRRLKSLSEQAAEVNRVR